MLDINFIRENPDLVNQNIQNRGVSVHIDLILAADNVYKETLQLLEKHRARLNEDSKTKPDELKIKELQSKKEMIKGLEVEIKRQARDLDDQLAKLPNIALDDVPGGGSENNKMIKQVGKPRLGGMEHWQLPGADKWIDTKAAVEISGSRFVYIVGDLAKVYYALMRYSQDLAIRHGYQPHVPPVLVKREAMYGSGFFPANEEESYQVNNDTDKLYLIGTSESVLVSRYQDDVVDLTKPIRMTATTTCFRREAGTYGKDEKGLFRLHQFDKVEMVTICQPADSEAEHQRMLSVEEELLSDLGLPYQVVLLAAGDAAIQSAKTYDCEGYFAGQKKYRELTSCSNCTDFQARRLKIRYRVGEKQTELAHTLNGTVCAMGRPLACIMEHYQTPKGFKVPKVLQKYCGLKEVMA